MPRAGHTLGPQGCPAELQHYETRLGIRLTASKLTRQHRQIARADPAVAAHLQRRIREPARHEAMMAGRTRYTSDTACSRCGSHTRTVYAAACWTCATTKRPLRTDSAGNVTGWPPSLRSRAGWLALCDERKRERQGERHSCTFGPFTATTTPTGKLSLSAPSLGISVADMGALPFDSINRMALLYPQVLDALRWASWT